MSITVTSLREALATRPTLVGQLPAMDPQVIPQVAQLGEAHLTDLALQYLVQSLGLLVYAVKQKVVAEVGLRLLPVSVLDLGLTGDPATRGAVQVCGLLVEARCVVVLGDGHPLVRLRSVISGEVRVTVADHLLQLRQVILRRILMTAVRPLAGVVLPEPLN